MPGFSLCKKVNRASKTQKVEVRTVRKGIKFGRTRTVSITTELPAFSITLTTPEGVTSDLKVEKPAGELEECCEAKTIEAMARNWNMLCNMAKRGQECVSNRSELMELVKYL